MKQNILKSLDLPHKILPKFGPPTCGTNKNSASQLTEQISWTNTTLGLDQFRHCTENITAAAVAMNSPRYRPPNVYVRPDAPLPYRCTPVLSRILVARRLRRAAVAAVVVVVDPRQPVVAAPGSHILYIYNNSTLVLKSDNRKNIMFTGK